jgi:cation diffusion facilitator CzcD-associated flavoprotein CzcO
MTTEVLDVVIIGAGVSGIGMARALKRECPHKRFVVLERRSRPGGTWDLFRFPGVRSDSDMHSYAYATRPWRSFKTLCDGASIRQYLEDSAREAGVDGAIRYGVRVREADWSSADQLWTLRVEAGDAATVLELRARFLVLGTGYYDHDHGHRPDLPGIDGFAGPVVHPQHWPEELDHAGKRVVVIGSGATAITLVPAMARSAAKVKMLQRSPSYLLALPSEDRLTQLLSRLLPSRWAFAAGRRLAIGVGNAIYRGSRRWPRAMRRLLLAQVRRQLAGTAPLADFEPRYAPWEQRLCIVSDGDLFERIRAGKAAVVTDEIDGFEAGRVRLRSGRSIEADIVVMATGLQLQSFGGMAVSVDGRPYAPGAHMMYRGVLLENLPNLAWIVGYINASWTLKADLAAAYVCRLLRHLDANRLAVAVARDREDCRLDETIMSPLQAGYVQRAAGAIPCQGRKAPWRMTHDYRLDRKALLDAPIADGILEFVPAHALRGAAGTDPPTTAVAGSREPRPVAAAP